jgi:hypothetical protein
MDVKIQQQLLDRSSDFINKASQTLGSTGAHVYEVLVRQQVVSGIGTIVAIILFCIIAAVSFFQYYQFAKRHMDESDDGFGWICGGIFGGFFFLMIVVIGVVALSDSVQHILNPEYYAISFIFDTIKGGK